VGPRISHGNLSGIKLCCSDAVLVVATSKIFLRHFLQQIIILYQLHIINKCLSLGKRNDLFSKYAEDTAAFTEARTLNL
jgi:hypothetical protein